MENALTELAAHGILGPILIFVWLHAQRLHKRLEEVQDKRVADAEAYSAKMLVVAQTVAENTSTIRDLVDALRQQRSPPP